MPAEWAHRVVFMGSKQLGLRSLESLIRALPGSIVGAVTIDDTGDARSAHDRFTVLARERGVPLTVARTRAEAAEAVRRHEPDLCVVCGWYWRVGRVDLERVPRGFVGVHFSALPKYRGGSPLVWQIINGEPEVGLSLFSFAEGIDEGPIWAQRLIPLGPDEAVGDVLARLEALSVDVLAEHVPRILSGDASARPQDPGGATYCASRAPGDGEIHWEWPARSVHDFIRAQSRPYPGAFTYAGDTRLTVWRSRREDVTYHATPGQVLRVGRDGVWVGCGDDRPLVVEQVALGGADCPAADVLASTTLRLGRSR